MKLLAVYVARDSNVNLAHGLKNGIWGFKNHAKPDNFEDLEAGDLILLASGYTGGSPRTPFDKWVEHSLALAYVAPIIGKPFKSSTPEWPDEPDMPEADRYVNRIKFDKSNVQAFSDISLRDETIMSHALSDSLRKSGSNAGRGYNLDAGEFRGSTVRAEQRPRFWVEKTLVSDRPDRQLGENALGRTLWSPQKAEGGRDIYWQMREVKPGDVVFHFIDNQALDSFSIVSGDLDDTFIGISGTEWAGRPAYRIPLDRHTKIVPPIDRNEFLREPLYKPLIEQLLSTTTGLFFNREFNLNQGSYITEAPLRLVQIWDDIHKRQTGGPLNEVWNIPPLEGVQRTKRHWIFQGNPRLFGVDEYVRARDEIRWSVRQHADLIHTGDMVLIWRSGENAGVVAVCLVQSEPELLPDDAPEIWHQKPPETEMRCKLKVLERFLDHPISREAIGAVLPRLHIIKAPQGTNFSLNQDEYAKILSLKGRQAQASLAEILRRYRDEQIVFQSSAQKRRYAIASFDDTGVSVERLDANEPQRVTFAQAETILRRLQAAGHLEFASLDTTVAVRNTILQAEPVALSADQKDIFYFPDNAARLANFLQVLDNLNVADPLYKPGMLLCVLEGIDSGDLLANEISFDWIAPRFIAKMKLLGKEVTEQQAAQPFYHLTGDLFWMHAVTNLKDLMQNGSDGPAAARNKIKYALLKDTYWNLLQDADCRTAVRRKLETFMIPKLSPDQILPAAQKAINDTGFVHAPDLVRRFISSIAAKPFVILTGNSGTGKTKLAQLLAHWMTGSIDRPPNGYAVVPVGADWTDNRNIVGFVNHLRKDGQQNPIYQSTPVLDLLLRAVADPARPYFLILDEMNLSHVERYFSDFLSAMESKTPVPLHQEKLALSTASGATVPRDIAFPENLYVIGTVNVDETTYMFSPKVLDRANVLEFRIEPEQAKNSLKSTNLNPIKPNLGAALAFLELSQRARGLAKPELPDLDEAALANCQQSLQDLFTLLHRVRLEFAFRTLAEVTRYLRLDFALSDQPSNWEWQRCLDAQILQKILPKLHGSRRRLEAILVALASYCEKRDGAAAQKSLHRDTDLGAYPSATPLPNVSFPLSRTKLVEMIEAVRRDQFVSYIQ